MSNVSNTTGWTKCDSACPAQAHFRVTLDVELGHELFFCAHHYNENEVEFLTRNYTLEELDSYAGIKKENKLVGSEN